MKTPTTTTTTTTMASKSKSTPTTPLLLLLLLISIQSTFAADPVPATWPLQFHSVLSMNNSGTLQVTDLWYDFPNGRNFNIIQNQLGDLIYDLEWDNGTSFVYTDHGCKVLHFPVGVLRPNFLDDAKFLGQKMVDGFVCNGWEKVDFIWYYEDVETKRPVYWEFFNGMVAHVMTFEVGAVLEDAKWQAPMSCFGKTQDTSEGFTKSKNTSEGFTKSKNTSEGFTESKDTGFSRAGKFMREPASTFAAAL